MQKKYFDKNFFIFLTLVLILGVCLLTLFILAVKKIVTPLDSKLLGWVVSSRTDTLTTFFKLITKVGKFLPLLAVSLLCVFISKNNFDRIYSLFGFLCACGASTVIKYMARRPRPEGYALISEISYSFPSGHATLMTSIALLLVYLCFKYLKNKPLKISLSVVFFAFAVFISYTRLYLGVHYITDVLGGILVGTIAMIMSYYILNGIFYAVENKIKTKEKTNKI